MFDESSFTQEIQNHKEELFLKKITDYEKHIAPLMRAKGYTRINESERTVVFTFGQMTFSRSRWRRGDKTSCPVDDWLGLEKYVRYSSYFMYHLACHASMMPYRQVCRFVKKAYGLDITKDAVLQAVKRVGCLLEAKKRYRFFKTEERIRKFSSDIIYVEGDGVRVKTTSGDERSNTDLAHFLVHTGSKRIAPNRFVLENKHEIIDTDYALARDNLLDYLYNHFDITDKTILVTNSDNGAGYTKRVFLNIKKALGIKRHEHFWDAYHVNDLIKTTLRPYSFELRDSFFKSIREHDLDLLKTSLDTLESLMGSEEELERFLIFKRRLMRGFKDTKPAHLRGLSSCGIGVMESQHRKVTYRMKHRGMYWSLKGACTMAKMILLERIDKLDELFFGSWQDDYKTYKDMPSSAGRLREAKKPHEAINYKRGRGWLKKNRNF